MEEEMYQDTTEYKLVYIYTIDDESHKGLLKIGDASLKSTKSYDQFPIGCTELNKAARKRIGEQTSTAGIMYHLCHTEIAVRKKGAYLEPFRDKKVHDILINSGIKRVQISTPGAKPTEWFQVDLDTARKAIKACKEWRKTLLSTEIVPEDQREIVLREEQEDAIKKTIDCFKTNSQMLWNAKMRYGKTATSLTFVKRQLKKYQKTIIITHRPVVESGWMDDFQIVFRKQECQFLTKDKDNDDSDDTPLVDQANEKQLKRAQQSGKPFIYFASIQDLRGSMRVGGKFNKNNAVFELDWDLIINDEAHEGTQTELGLKVSAELKKPNTKLLSLSGTPFNIINQFDDDSVYTWDYPMEQAKKKEWDALHPGDPNPYADLPQMHIYTYNLGELIKGYSPELEDKAFNFTEFFRTWTGDDVNDEHPMPQDAVIGEFIHKKDVRHFLDLITTESEDSAYPFSTSEYRNMFRHTLWMIPGVKEALALEKMLREHPIFKNFKVANVAGEGDYFEEIHYDNALEKVVNTIKENDYSITLSCGKLTTGVTVREWTACFMLSGSYSTGAASYLQTIFRVQSPGQINGKTKEHSYVFDFAPDRTLVVLAEAANVSRKGGSGGNNSDANNREAMKNFLNFCPVLAISGTQMRLYSVNSMMEQLKKVYAERAIRTGFDDSSIYNERLLTLDSLDIAEFETLKKAIGATKAQKIDRAIVINDQGFTEEEYEKLKELKKKPNAELSEEQKAERERLKKQKEERGKAISILRGISVRMPLLIYGADVPFEEEITLDRFVELIDEESWKEFMPDKVSKKLFHKFSKYYDQDVFIAAGREIRRLAKRADQMLPTQRIQSITKLFSYFRNPDKETVLTPWRVVNMHMSDCLGGYDFWNDDHNEAIEEPRFVDRGEVTAKTLGNPDAKILEINSKTGLYALYSAYSIYRTKCSSCSSFLTEEKHKELWADTIKNNVFVICKTEMAKYIARRTLLGYGNEKINTHFFQDLINQFKNKSEQVTKKIKNPNYWDIKGEKEVRFDAIVGNPPYQDTNGSGGTNDAPVYQYFVMQAKALKPQYYSLIIPSRWYSGGRENLLGVFRKEMLFDTSIKRMVAFINSQDVFTTVDIKGGLCYFLSEYGYSGDCSYSLHESKDSVVDYQRRLDEFDVLVRNPRLVSILKKVRTLHEDTVASQVSGDTPFGIPTNPASDKKLNFSPERTLKQDTILYYIEKLKRKTSYIPHGVVKKNCADICKPKVFVPKAAGTGTDPHVLGKPIMAESNSVCSQTFLYIAFQNDNEAKNFISYYETKFFRVLVSACKLTQEAPSRMYMFVPVQDFSKSWTDQELYTKYGLTQKEIEIIETTIKPMEGDT